MEIELKLRLEPSAAKRLSRLSVIRAAAASRQRRKLLSIYFDTPALDLQRLRMALRVRRVDGKWVQTLKGGGGVVAGLHQRAEWEAAVKAASPELQHIPAEVLQQLSPQQWQQLVPVFVTDFWRTTWQLAGPQGAIEVALDQGLVRSGERVTPLHELELELKQGEPEQLFLLAGQLLDQVPWQLDSVSKAERGYRLYLDAPVSPVKAQSPQLSDRQSAIQGWTVIVAECLRHWQRNEAGYMESPDNSEFLHQMRVALRRLRSAMQLFRPLLRQRAVSPLLQELDWLMSQLGPARDWDVLREVTLPAAQIKLNGGALAAAVSVLTERAHEQARQAVISARMQRLLLQLGQVLLKPPSRKKHANDSLTGFALMALAARHKKVSDDIRLAHKLTCEERHHLRVDAKKLRYALGFFSNLLISMHGEAGFAEYREAVTDLQDHLGGLNDLVVARGLLARLVQQDAGLQSQVDAMAVALRKRERRLLEQLKPSGKAFGKLQPFWIVSADTAAR